MRHHHPHTTTRRQLALFRASLPLCTAFLLSCADFSDDEKAALAPAEGGIVATIDSRPSFNMTRTKMIDSPGTGINVKWAASDEIGVFSSAGNNLKYALPSTYQSDGFYPATFKGDAGTPTGEFSAYYPYQSDAVGTPTTGLTLTMSAKQQHVTNGLTGPDPAAGAMVGTGRDGSITLRSVHAILKIGYVSKAEADEVTAITFRDLSGRPVSGSYVVKMVDGVPEATFPDAPVTAADATLTLDCKGEGGVTNFGVTYFYMIVPARFYEKGFELTFHLLSGDDETRTIGKTVGRRLERAMLYPVGEVSVVRDDAYTMELNGPGFMMTEEQLSMVEGIWPLDDEEFVRPEDAVKLSVGDALSKAAHSGPKTFAMVVDKHLKIEEGMTIIINRPSEALPYGLIACVTSVQPQNDRLQYVELGRYLNVEKAFKTLKIGGTQYDDDGHVVGGEGASIDMASTATYEAADLDREGIFPYDSLRAVTNDSVENAATRAKGDGMTHSESHPTSPKFTVGFYKDGKRKLYLSTTVGLDTKVDVEVRDGKMRHTRIDLTPFFNFEIRAQWELEGGVDAPFGKDLSWPLSRIVYYTPITVGPFTFFPLVRGSVGLDFTAALNLFAVWNYNPKYQILFDVKRKYKTVPDSFYGAMEVYDDETDWAVNDLTQYPDVLSPTVGSEGSLSVGAHLYMDIGFAVYGFLDIGLYVDPNLSLQAYVSYDGKGDCGVRLLPTINFGSFVGNLRHEFDVKWEFAPLWEWKLFPHYEYIDYAADRIPNALRTSSRAITVGTYCTGINDTYRNPVHRQEQHYLSDGDNIPIDISYKLEGKPLMPLNLRWALYNGPAGGSSTPFMTFDAGRYLLPDDRASSFNIPCSELTTIPDDADDDPNPTTPCIVYLYLEEGLKGNWVVVSGPSDKYEATMKIRLWWSPTTKTVTEEDGIGSTRVITKFYRKLNAQVLDCRDAW